MKKKKVWRYWCDFCGKGGCNKFCIAEHEKYCTRNPQRICRMCQLGNHQQMPFQSLEYAFDIGGLTELRTISKGCPACMLSGILAWKKNHPREEYIEWDYKKECAEYLKEADKPNTNEGYF